MINDSSPARSASWSAEWRRRQAQRRAARQHERIVTLIHVLERSWLAGQWPPERLDHLR